MQFTHATAERIIHYRTHGRTTFANEKQVFWALLTIRHAVLDRLSQGTHRFVHQLDVIGAR
jgi:hypothetical protein